MAREHKDPANLAALIARFKECYSTDPAVLVQAPGRVNLIGEHTDYNGGFVLPVAIDRFVTVLAAPRNDAKLGLFSTTFPAITYTDLDTIEPDQEDENWTKYVAGMSWAIRKGGYQTKGANMLVDSNVPLGAGLSSSAALEMGVGYAFNLLGNLGIERKKLALLGQKAENEYVGAQTGIMDQFISAMGQRESALLIDCANLSEEIIPFRLSAAGCKLVVINSGIKHAHAGGEYNQRRAECTRAVEMIAELVPNQKIESLRDVSLTLFREVEDRLPLILRKRARHVITDNARTVSVANALKENNFAPLKELMYSAHISMRDDYEISVPEIDLLVELANAQEGCLGTRMTGGGFGGCTVNIVREEALDTFITNVVEVYQEKTQRQTAQWYACQAEDGVAGRSL